MAEFLNLKKKLNFFSKNLKSMKNFKTDFKKKNFKFFFKNNFKNI